VNLQILSEAENELEDAVAHYQEIESGLGTRLKDEVRNALLWIREHPQLPPMRRNRYRRVNLKLFRYYIAYFIHADTIWILAIAHSYRQPEYWIGRKTRID
jgi:hypothetical protein